MSAFATLAAAQSVPVAGDVDANVEAHLALVRLAATEGADAIVFPELSLTGYELERAPALAFGEDDPRLRPLRDAATAHAVALVVGAPAQVGARLHLGAFLLTPDGGIDLYTKRHLGAFSDDAKVDGTPPPPEKLFFEPGDRDPLVRLGADTAAVAVCADTGRPAHSEAAARRGVAAYLASMFVIPSALEGDYANLAGIARRHGLHVVFANFGGPSGGLASGGGSAIFAAGGERLAALGPRGAGVVVASWKGARATGRAIPL